MPFEPTAEQLAGRDAFVAGTPVLVVEAGAGSGKTSLLEDMARHVPRRRDPRTGRPGPRRTGQLTAFNRAIIDDCAGRFPDNVNCSTAHALAFRAIGRPYQHRLDAERVRARDVAQMLDLHPTVISTAAGSKRLSAGAVATHVQAAVWKFCETADPELDVRHFPELYGAQPHAAQALAVRLLPAARRMWADMLNPEGRLPYRPCCYLKQWQLSGPVIPADFVMFDEAQDADPVMISIVEAQAAHARIVVVGDSQQQIYEWRGAVNALAEFKADKRLWLTRSFRFGPEIAEVANSVLEGIDGAQLRISGDPGQTGTVGEVPDPAALLCRTNGRAVDAVMAAQAEGRRSHLVGNVRKEAVAFARAAQSLKESGWAGHPQLACFGSWAEVQWFCEEDPQGSELKAMVELVDKYTPEKILAALADQPPEAHADLVVSTGHQSKGREWESVQLASDFDMDPEKLEDGDRRLLYVAVTRARRRLDITRVSVLAGDRQRKAAVTDLAAYAARRANSGQVSLDGNRNTAVE